MVGIDSLAAESELAVIADHTTNPEWVAADLLAQAEHGPGGAAIVITWSEEFADAVDAQLDRRSDTPSAGSRPRRRCSPVAGSSSSTAPRRPSPSPTRSRPSTCSS